MITLFTGVPGAGKTASMVNFLSELSGDRPIFVHYNPASKTSPDQVLLSEGLKIKHTPIMADDWSSLVPDGAILVIDEVQDVWRPRGSGSKVPPAVQHLETHRHRGIDILLTTQAPRLLDSNVRGLVGRHVHIRDTGVLGRHWYEWPEVNDDLNWKSCINKKPFKLPKKAFQLYKSANLHVKPVFGVPRSLYLIVLCVLLLIGLGWYGYRSISSKLAPPPAAAAVKAPGQIGESGFASSGAGQRPIDDRIDWTPRISHMPESAPAYDKIRTVLVMPVVTGAACINEDCKCFTAQGTDARLSVAECRAWAKSPPFNPYLAPVIVQPMEAKNSQVLSPPPPV